ncbi:hypothetical protein GGX14DRAFT_395402 [Mycena pura]|uniref:Uncharacterized protein n=1 Tax=Mycena pura TaxID=153505 RepID=A0AAD6YB37_9AGAR|nr:hypothetical protein GGX14DRAFT_395402 [Mycena pura]
MKSAGTEIAAARRSRAGKAVGGSWTLTVHGEGAARVNGVRAGPPESRLGSTVIYQVRQAARIELAPELGSDSSSMPVPISGASSTTRGQQFRHQITPDLERIPTTTDYDALKAVMSMGRRRIIATYRVAVAATRGCLLLLIVLRWLVLTVLRLVIRNVDGLTRIDIAPVCKGGGGRFSWGRPQGWPAHGVKWSGGAGVMGVAVGVDRQQWRAGGVLVEVCEGGVVVSQQGESRMRCQVAAASCGQLVGGRCRRHHENGCRRCRNRGERTPKHSTRVLANPIGLRATHLTRQKGPSQGTPGSSFESGPNG